MRGFGLRAMGNTAELVKRPRGCIRGAFEATHNLLATNPNYTLYSVTI